jgi:hypothetical protein
VNVLPTRHHLEGPPATYETGGTGLDGMDLYETWDAGRTWTITGHAAIKGISYAAWADRLHCMVQGVPIACSGSACGGAWTILLTNDGGQTWHLPF